MLSISYREKFIRKMRSNWGTAEPIHIYFSDNFESCTAKKLVF